MNLTKQGDVFVLTLDDGENRLNPDSLRRWSEALAEVESTPGPRALVTVGEGKIWSNGIDLATIAPEGAGWDDFLTQLHRLYAQLLGANFPTVAALQGHAFAGGLMLALCHDVRIMREDRGWLCLPEIDLGMPFTDAMTALVTAKLGPQLTNQAMITGSRYTASESVRVGMVDSAVPEGEVLNAAVALAQQLADKDRTTMGTIKGRLYAPALLALRS